MKRVDPGNQPVPSPDDISDGIQESLYALCQKNNQQDQNNYRQYTNHNTLLLPVFC
jgi:hypothetical protein